MHRRSIGNRERTVETAESFLEELRRDLEKAVAAGFDLPPRLRTVHTRAGHATPEYRTLAIPAAVGVDTSPEMLSMVIARYSAARPPTCMILILHGTTADDSGTPLPVLMAEARDASGTRLFWMQMYEIREGRIAWRGPSGGGWQDPGEQELILDRSFNEQVEADQSIPNREVLATPTPVA